MDFFSPAFHSSLRVASSSKDPLALWLVRDYREGLSLEERQKLVTVSRWQVRALQSVKRLPLDLGKHVWTAKPKCRGRIHVAEYPPLAPPHKEPWPILFLDGWEIQITAGADNGIEQFVIRGTFRADVVQRDIPPQHDDRAGRATDVRIQDAGTLDENNGILLEDQGLLDHEMRDGISVQVDPEDRH